MACALSDHARHERLVVLARCRDGLVDDLQDVQTCLLGLFLLAELLGGVPFFAGLAVAFAAFTAVATVATIREGVRNLNR